MTDLLSELPDRTREGLDRMRMLAADGVHLAAVRHHSPVCATAVRTLIEEVRPTAVLIEGPEEYTALIPDLLREHTRPPVALLSHGPHASGFFPLAEFSPEWVALRAGAEAGAELSFIDLPWSQRQDTGDDVVARSVMSEAALAHSRTLAALARRLHCRDHDDLWDHLVELRSTDQAADWRTVFREVAVWADLARVDATQTELRADGSLAREERMAGWVRARRERDPAGPVVVVTGAFHTLALADRLTSGEVEVPAGRAAEPAWLVRYDFARLDALHGYGAGMRSPGFYQRVWRADLRFDPTQLLVDVARSTRGTADPVGTAEVLAATQAAHRLAALRGHPSPGRCDVLDAITSCYVSADGDWPPAVRDAVASAFGGTALGEVPPDTTAPPLVSRTRDRARRHRLTLTDSSPRRTEIDRLRSAEHRAKARFLALMSYLGTGFARQLSGLDLAAGTGRGRLYEQWEYAWTPLVESELIRLAGRGADLEDLAVARLGEELSTPTDSADRATRLLGQAVALGVLDRMPGLGDEVAELLARDPGTGSVLAAVRRLLMLWHSRDGLDLGDAPVSDLVALGVLALTQRVPDLGGVPPERDAEAVSTLLGIVDLVAELDDAGLGVDPGPLRHALDRLTAASSPAVSGAALTVAVARDSGSVAEWAEAVSRYLGVGADAETSVRFISGVLHAGPDLVIRDDRLRTAVDAAVTRMSESTFLTLLPDLRHAFARLRPRDTALLAERLRGDGIDGPVDVHVTGIDAPTLRRGIALERALRAQLAAEGL
ncbi:DUF5682 family protein [Cellulomonas sp. NPDC089187]|uniref:DUF5682 family protein n=1 Tax=Cellulomonas sp. NPDC089187 TaxID=3154970 RepID=UPI00344AE532